MKRVTATSVTALFETVVASVTVLTFVTVVTLAMVNTSPVPKELVTENSKFKICPVRPPMLAPCDLRVGHDGGVWIVDILQPIFCRLDPATCHVECYQIPYTLPPNNVSLPPVIGQLVGLTDFGCAMAAGYDGNLYASLGIRGGIARVNPFTREVQVVTPPRLLDNLFAFNSLAESPDGIFFSLTTGNEICLYHYTTADVTCYPAPNPMSMYYAKDGYLYTTARFGNTIGMLNPRTKAFKEFVIPLGGQGAGDIRAETSTNKTHPFIWFTSVIGNTVGRLDPNNGDFKLFPNLPGGTPASIQVDSEENIWFTTLTQAYLGKVDSRTGVVSAVSIPNSPVSLPFVNSAISCIYNETSNVLWFNEAVAGNIGGYFLD